MDFLEKEQKEKKKMSKAAVAKIVALLVVLGIIAIFFNGLVVHRDTGLSGNDVEVF